MEDFRKMSKLRLLSESRFLRKNSSVKSIESSLLSRAPSDLGVIRAVAASAMRGGG